jgi:hypothetical protein
MGPESILLSVRDDADDGSYRFTCPSCTDDVEKRADRKIVALLVSAGVDVDRIDARLALFGGSSADGAQDGPALTIDDVIEFHYLLQDDDVIGEFMDSIQQG